MCMYIQKKLIHNYIHHNIYGDEIEINKIYKQWLLIIYEYVFIPTTPPFFQGWLRVDWFGLSGPAIRYIL